MTSDLDCNLLKQKLQIQGFEEEKSELIANILSKIIRSNKLSDGDLNLLKSAIAEQ